MKYLDSEQLARLDAAWRDFVAGARTRVQRRIRLRLHGIYLIIRHGGLRLSETLQLDAGHDLGFASSTIRVGGDRSVQLPERAMQALMQLADDPLLRPLGSSLTHVDAGYVRRNFYLVAEAAGLERTMGGPRALRHSRGRELVESGIPLPIVQRMRGLQSPVQAVQLKDFRDGEARQILHAHLRRETLRHTSARNVFAGTISRIETGATMALVTLTSLSGIDVRASLSLESVHDLRLHEGQTVTASVKAPWVTVTPPHTVTSLANNFQGRVTKLRAGGPEVSVRLRLDDGSGMAALMTVEAAGALGLRPDMACTVSFSSMAVALSQS